MIYMSFRPSYLRIIPLLVLDLFVHFYFRAAAVSEGNELAIVLWRRFHYTSSTVRIDIKTIIRASGRAQSGAVTGKYLADLVCFPALQWFVLRAVLYPHGTTSVITRYHAIELDAELLVYHRVKSLR